MLDPCVLTTKSTSTLNVLENLPLLTSVISVNKEEKDQERICQIIVDCLQQIIEQINGGILLKKFPKLTKLALS